MTTQGSPSQTPLVYCYSRRELLKTWIIAGFMLAIAAGMLWVTFIAEVDDFSRSPVVWSVLAGGAATLGLATIASALAYRLTLLPAAIELRSMLSTRRAALSGFTGFRLMNYQGQTSLLLIGRPGTKGMDIDLQFKPDEAFEAWLALLPNLDWNDQQEIRRKIEQDSALGASPDERVAYIQRKFAVANRIFYSQLAVVLWVIIYPKPYELAVLVAALMPFVVLGFYWNDREGFTFSDDRMATKVSLLPSFIFSTCLLSVRALADSSAVNPVDYVVPVLCGSLLTYVAGRLVIKDALDWTSSMFLLVYPLSVIPMANFMLDHTAPRAMVSEVYAKHAATGRGSSNSLSLRPWVDVASSKESVSQRLYEQTPVGGKVCILVYRGAVNVAWHEIRPLSECRLSAPTTSPR